MSYHDEVIRDNPSAYWSFQDAPGGKGTRVNLCPDPSLDGSNPISQYWKIDSGSATVTKHSGVTNLLSNYTAGFDNNTTGGWTVGTSVTLAATNASVASGAYSLSFTCNSIVAGYMSAYSSAISTAATPVLANTAYTVSAATKAATAARTANIGICWIDSGGAQISQVQSSNVTNSTSAYTTLTHTATSPANAAYAAVYVVITAPALNEVHYVDTVGIWQGTGGLYVPGGQTSPFSYTGPQSLAVTCTSGGAVQASQKTNTLAEFSVVDGKTYTVSAKALGTVANATSKIGFVWRFASGATYTDLSAAQSTSSTAWSTLSFSSTVPANATSGRVIITSTMATNEVIYLDAFLVEQTASVRGYFDGDTLDGAWLTDKSGISVFGVSRTNAVNDPRITTVNNVVTWQATNYNNRQIATGGPDGGSYIENVVTNAGVTNSYTVPGTLAYMIPVQPGGDIVISYYAKASALKTTYIYGYWYDKNGTLMNQQGANLGQPPIISEWQRLSTKMTAPLNSAYFRLSNIVYSSPVAIGDTFSAACVMIETGDTLNEYFDGSYDDCSWKGTAHQSFSITSTVNDETAYNNTALSAAGWTRFPQASEEYNSVVLDAGSEMVYTDYYPVNLLSDNQASMETSVVTTGTSNCTVATSASYAYHGTKSGKATATAGGAMQTGNLASVSATAGETYTVSGYVMSDKPGGMGIGIIVGFTGAYDTPQTSWYRVNANSSGWTRFEQTFVAPAGTTAMAPAFYSSGLLGGQPAAGQSLYFDGLSIAAGASGRWKLPSATTMIPANTTDFPVRALNGLSNQKPFVFECLFKPDSYKSNVALLETYTRADRINLLGKSGLSGGTSITSPTDKGIFGGRVLTDGSNSGTGVNNMGVGTTVTSWDNRSFDVSACSYGGGTITYTAPGHTFIVGNSVSISGISPTSYNVQATIASVSGDNFTITKTIAGGAYVSGGVVKATVVNLSVANTGDVDGFITSTSVNGSGFYYADGQVYFRAYGVDRFNKVVDSRVEYNLPDINSHHLAFRVAGSEASIYVDGKLVATDQFTLPYRYDNISGYRSKTYAGSGWLSNVALYNSSISMTEIANHFQEKAGVKDNLITYAGQTKQIFDVSSKNNTTTDSLNSPTVTPWSAYTSSNLVIDTKENTIGLQKFAPLVPHDTNLTFTADGANLVGNGLFFEDADSVMAGDFAVTATIKFNLYTQDADSYDKQRFCIFQIVSDDKASSLSAYRILQDVSGTIYTYIVLGLKLPGQDEILEYLDYSSYGTTFPTSAFNIMLKRYGNTISLVSYDNSTGLTQTATIDDEHAVSLNGPLYIGMDSEHANFGQFSVTNLKIADTIESADEFNFMINQTVPEKCYAPLTTANNYGIAQRGYATNSVVPSAVNSDGSTNTTVNDMRVLWEPEVSNIKVSMKTNRNLLTSNQASVEVDTTGFNNPFQCTLARSTAQYSIGSASLAATATAASMAFYTPIGTAGVPASPGETFTAVVSAKAGAGSASIYVGIRFYNSGASLGDNAGTSTTVSTSAWTQLTATATAPANTTHATLFVVGAVTNANVYYFDQFGLWRGTDTSWAPPYHPDGVNMLTPNLASIETDATGFGYNVVTGAKTTAKFLNGTSSLAVTSTGAGTAQVYNTTGVPIEPGREYTVTVSGLTASITRSAQASLWFYDSTGVYVSGSQALSTAANLSTTEWKNYSVTGVAPPTAAFAKGGMQISGVAGASEVFYIDCLGLMPGASQKWSMPTTDSTVWQPISESGLRPSWFINNGSVPYKNDIRIDFTTEDSWGDAPELYSLKVAYDTLGDIEEIKSGEKLTITGSTYTLAESNLPVTSQAKNGGFRQLSNSYISYQPDITRDNIITNWSFQDYSGWDSNEDESIVVDKMLSGGVGMAIPMSSAASLFTSSDTKYNVISSAQYTLCVYAKADGDAAAVATINWQNEAGTSAGSPATSSSTPLDTSVVPLTLTATAPATAKSATISIAFTGTDEQTVTVDSVVMNEGAATISIDDNSPFIVFPQAHTYKTIAMVVRTDSDFYTSSAKTLFDSYNGSTRYRLVVNAGGQLSYSGFTRAYVNGSAHNNGGFITGDGWIHIIATIDDGGSINPSSSRIATFLSTTTGTEYGTWSLDSVWFQRPVATQASATNDYQEIFGRINEKVYDVLSATTILGSEEYRTISTPWTQVSSPR